LEDLLDVLLCLGTEVVVEHRVVSLKLKERRFVNFGRAFDAKDVGVSYTDEKHHDVNIQLLFEQVPFILKHKDALLLLSL
jgi:hypothetical protein